MVKSNVYKMCFPVCLWQYSVRAESFHASGVHMAWARVWPCGAVFSCLWWGLNVTPVCCFGCVDILICLRYCWQLQVCCGGGRDFLVLLNPLTPSDPYRGRTAPLTSKRCILYIYSTNIGTEYFKHAIYSPFCSLQNVVCFIILTYLVPVLFTFYIQVC